MVLSDVDIVDRIRQKSIIISPLDFGDIQGASVDVHLGNEYKVLIPDGLTHIVPRQPLDAHFNSITSDWTIRSGDAQRMGRDT